MMTSIRPMPGGPSLPTEETAMKVSEVMTRDVRLADPNQTISEAARLMAETDAGALPVRENDRLVGVITDRDIAVRAVADHKSPDTPVREVMTKEVLYCYEDSEIEDCARNMAESKVRRMPVVNREKRLVGIVSFGDLARAVQSETTGQALAEISAPGGAHSQTRH
jgi:CBS domain-containing protein